MSALAELRSGETGGAFNDLLIKTIAAVAAARNFPPPEGRTWTDEQVADVARSYLVHRRTPAAIGTMLFKCGDDHALAVYLQGVVRNFLRDLGRATEIGRLTIRVRRALGENTQFVRSDGDYWGLAGGGSEPSGQGPDALIAAAATVEVTFVRWNPTSKRKHPFADKRSVDDLIRSVLTAADGTVRAPEIARAIAPCLHVVAGAQTVELDGGDYPDSDWRPAGADLTGDEVVDRERAIEVFGMLSDRQKIALGAPKLTVRELGRAMGRQHTQAAVIKNDAIELVRAELGDEENGARVGELVIEFAKIWVDDRTDPNVVTY